MNDQQPTLSHGSSERAVPASRRVAVLGTGKMGSAIAARLAAAGFELVPWDRTRERAVALGIGPVADSPADAVARADVVISSLTGPDAVTSTYAGAEGALVAARGKLFIEMSTAGPDLEIDVARDVVAAGARFVEAPIIGAPPVVRDGKAAILAGGSNQDVDDAEPVLSVLGTVRHVGPVGTAARLKLVANSMLADIVLSAAELQVAGEQAGIKPDDVFWVLERLAPLVGVRRRGFVDDVHEPTLFALRDLHKDLDLAMGVFKGSGVAAPLTELARQLVADATDEYGGLDITALARPYRERARSTDEEEGTRQALATSHRT